jgi:hypothetical protein
VRDAAEGSHATRDDDHDVEGIGAAHERDVHALETMGSDSVRDPEAFWKFLGENSGGVLALNKMDFVESRIDRVQQALGVD